MIESLKYRIPGNSTIELEGKFVALQSWSNFNGFVFSNFEGTEFYGFSAESSDLNKRISVYKKVPFVISKEDYLKDAKALIQELRTKKMAKVILSRVKKVNLEEVNQDVVFHRLLDKYPEAFVYSIKSKIVGNWIGATPERLIDYKNGIGKTVSLAGTKLSSDDNEWGEKERLEQLYVTDFVEDKLINFAKDIERGEIKDRIAGPVKHLITEFNFEIDSSRVLDLVLDLHPTPAISGMPRLESMQLIKNIERHQRRLYAGIIGLIQETEINLFVNLRSCQIIDANAYLYVGGGFTIDSIPELEWDETENKALTIINVLQNK